MTMSVRDLSADRAPESVTRTVTAKLPDDVGVPAINPLLEPRLNPPGSEPAFRVHA